HSDRAQERGASGGAPAFGVMSAMPILVGQGREVPMAFRRFGRPMLVAFAQGGVLFVGFLILAVLKLI
ncbi:hypothetical protein NL533_33765, partial [Klebsiella pneumoniae]|nr:hypothetical protein [Klebsiella pneumoniae]